MSLVRRTGRLALGLLAVLAVAGCEPSGRGAPRGGAEPQAGEAAEPILIYSGRNESLVGPLLDRLRKERGLEVRVRYGETAELAATLLEEGENTPADLFLSQDAAALGALSRAGMLRPLPSDLLDLVPKRFRSPSGDWVGVSGRARCVVYNTERISPEELPRSLQDLALPRYRGRFGIAPANASFQAHMAVYRVTAGAAALAELLAGIEAAEPRRYPKNGAIVQAAIDGEIDFGLVNHYYLWRALAEDPGAPAANYFMTEGRAASFVNLAGVGVLSDRADAVAAVRYLLAAEAQRYFAEQTFEYPVAAGVPPAVDLPPLESLDRSGTAFAEVSTVLEQTLTAIHDAGLLR